MTLTAAVGVVLALSWTAPDAYTNGDLLTPTQIDHYTVEWACDTGKAGAYTITDGAATSATVQTDAAHMLGLCDFWLTVTDKQGLTSDPSETIIVRLRLNKPARGGVR